MTAPAQTPKFGFGPWETGFDDVSAVLKHASQADRDGLDLFTISDHPYAGSKLDAYAILGVVLGSTSGITGAVNVTNLPSRPAPMLARSLTSLSALSGGRVALGLGAGGSWDDIVRMGVQRLSPAEAVRALEEAVVVIRKLSGGGAPVTFEGEFYSVYGATPSPAAAPPVWTGSVGPKSLAVAGRVADGWFPGHASDWASDLYRESRPRIDEAAVAAGRDPAEITTIFNLPGRITDKPLPRTRDEDGRWAGGSVDQWVEELTYAVLERGAGGFVFFDFADPAPTDVCLGRWAREIVPAVREALAKS